MNNTQKATIKIKSLELVSIRGNAKTSHVHDDTQNNNETVNIQYIKTLPVNNEVDKKVQNSSTIHSQA